MAKYGKIEGGPFEDIKNFLEKKEKLRILSSSTVPKTVKEGHFGFFNIHSVAKLKGALWCNPKVFVKSLTVPKKIQKRNSKIAKGDPLYAIEVLDVGFFCFG